MNFQKQFEVRNNAFYNIIQLIYLSIFTEVTSIRSGLRKRKRAESPQPTEPQISEEWVEEDKLELWEIKFIGEKIEKTKLMTTTRSVAQQRQSDSSSSSVNSSNGGSNKCMSTVKASSEDVKEKIEQQQQQIKIQRTIGSQLKKTIDVARPSPQGTHIYIYID